VTDTKQRSSDSDNPGLELETTVASAFSYLVPSLGGLVALLGQATLLSFGAVVLTRIAVWSEIATLLENLVIGIVIAPVSVSVHRAVILHEPIMPAKYLSSFLQRRVRKYIGYGLLMTVFLCLGILVGFLIAGAVEYLSSSSGQDLSLLVKIIPSIVIVGTSAYLFRMAFIFPAIAVDEFRSFADARRLMRGFALKVFGVMFVVAIPIAIFQAAALGFANIVTLGILFLLSILWFPLLPAVLSVAYTKASP